MGLSRTVSEINSDISWISQNVSIPVYFAPQTTEFPLELGIGDRNKKLEWRCYRMEKEVW